MPGGQRTQQGGGGGANPAAQKALNFDLTSGNGQTPSAGGAPSFQPDQQPSQPSQQQTKPPGPQLSADDFAGVGDGWKSEWSSPRQASFDFMPRGGSKPELTSASARRGLGSQFDDAEPKMAPRVSGGAAGGTEGDAPPAFEFDGAIAGQ